MRTAGVCVGDVKYREKWRSRTRVADPKNLGGRQKEEKENEKKIPVLQNNNFFSHTKLETYICRRKDLTLNYFKNLIFKKFFGKIYVEGNFRNDIRIS